MKNLKAYGGIMILLLLVACRQEIVPDTQLETTQLASIAITPGSSNVSFFLPGTTEALTFFVERQGGLEGDITITGRSSHDLIVGSATLPADKTSGTVVLPVTAAADAKGSQGDIIITARSGRVRKSIDFSTFVRSNDSQNMELLSYVPLASMGAPNGDASANWGWTDPLTGKEYALTGMTTGVSFVDISNPRRPRYLGLLPTNGRPADFANLWREMKVYKNHLFVVSEATNHGVQIFDLTGLRNITSPRRFTATAVYKGVGQAHTITINEATGFAYVNGATDTNFPRTCFGGLHMIDIRVPTAPKFVGCFSGSVPEGQPAGNAYPSDVYTHDSQCVIYKGPDSTYRNKEICFTSDGQVNESGRDFLGVVDVSDKANPKQVSRKEYKSTVPSRQSYAHQGWLSEDQSYFYLNDEFDEFNVFDQTTTLIWDVRDLDNPKVISLFNNPRDTIGHNEYVKGNYLYQSNYTGGLRIANISNRTSPTEVAYFDTYPEDNGFDGTIVAPSELAKAKCGQLTLDSSRSSCTASAFFNGVWNTYPFFKSGVVIVSDIDRGLFVFRPKLTQ
jgi:choice-of-anchor B domain-containing protein